MSTIAKIKELYRTLPGAVEEYANQRYTRSLNDILSELSQNLPDDICFETQNEYDRSSGLALVLGCLPAVEIIRNFGENALLWTWLRTVFMTKAQELEEQVAQHTGRNKDLLERARISLWQKSILNYDVKTFKKAYDLISLTERVAKNINLANLLQAFAKSGVVISKDKIEKYSLETLSVTEKWPYGYSDKYRWKKEKNGLFYSIYLDAPVGICLKYEGLPNAVVSFFPKTADSLLIYQMQGLRGNIKLEGSNSQPAGHARGLAVLNYLEFCVNLAASIGKELGFKKIGIQSGNNNRWTREKNNDGTVHFPLEKAIQIYDGTAKNLGFIKDIDNDWYVDL